MPRRGSVADLEGRRGEEGGGVSGASCWVHAPRERVMGAARRNCRLQGGAREGPASCYHTSTRG